MEISRDIAIGENESIKWIEFDINAKDTNIDKLLLKTKQFWTYIETECVSGCCGIDAFSFLPEDIKIAKEKFIDPQLSEYLIELKREIHHIETDIISSLFLNNHFHKIVLLKLINHLLKNITQCK